MDKLPEVFRRFEMDVDTDRIRSFDQLRASFRLWAGYKWKGSDKQMEALKREARKIGIPVGIERRPVFLITWRHEIVKVMGQSQHRYRNLKTGRFIKKP